MHHRTFASLVALGLATSTLAQPAPLAKRIGGMYGVRARARAR
jgi:hypothetical protein